MIWIYRILSGASPSLLKDSLRVKLSLCQVIILGAKNCGSLMTGGSEGTTTYFQQRRCVQHVGEANPEKEVLLTQQTKHYMTIGQ